MVAGNLAFIVNLAAKILLILLLARVVLSWLRLPPFHPLNRRLAPFVVATTEPLLRPIRRLLLRYQRDLPIDFSPLVLYLLIDVVRHLLLRLLSISL